MGNILTLTEILFGGSVSKLNFEFLKDLLYKSEQVRYNFPEGENIDYNFIVNLLKNSEYVDIAFDSLILNSIPNVFANLVLDNERVELLFFLDLKDIRFETNKESVDMLITWAQDFGVTYNFEVILCQPDNAEKDEFYFKNGNYGSCYWKI